MQTRGYLVGLGILMVLIGAGVFVLQVLNPIGGGLVEHDDFSVYAGEPSPPHDGAPEGGAASVFVTGDFGEVGGDPESDPLMIADLQGVGDSSEGSGEGADNDEALAEAGDTDPSVDSSTESNVPQLFLFVDESTQDDLSDEESADELDTPPGISQIVDAWSDRIASVEERGFELHIEPGQLQLPQAPAAAQDDESESEEAVTVGAAPHEPPVEEEDAVDAADASLAPQSPAVDPATETQSPSDVSDPVPQSPYIITHVVQPHEALSTIARRYGVSVETIAAMNRISDPNRIRVGDTLQIPSADGVMHVVHPGDSLWSISVAYGVSVDAIVAVNQITTPDSIRVGDIIFVPGIEAAQAYQLGESVVDASGRLVRNFSWPVENTVTSGFGPRWGRMHNGIDIRASVGTPVRAAASGTVTFAKTGENGGYGYLIVIDHGHGVETRYAHNSQLLVKEGDRVERGQVIARSGATGNVTGPHVHFEIRHYGVAVDPLDYLR